MSPRAAPTRSDETALKFLGAAAELIDASMLMAEPPHPRLRQIKFPAVLEWIRVEDVLLVANQQHESGISKKAFLNRWPTRDEFLRDAVVFAMLYRDEPESRRPDPTMVSGLPRATSFSSGIQAIAEQAIAALTAHPRSFLLCYVAPYLPRHPDIADALRDAFQQDHDRWTEQYLASLTALGVRLRPDWTADRVSVALQALVDGFVLRDRLQPSLMRANEPWRTADLVADTAIALLGGAIDFEGDGRTSRDAVDDRVRSVRR